MKVIFDDRQLLHVPKKYLQRSKMIDHPEQPERARLLLSSLANVGHEIMVPENRGYSIIRKIHDTDFVDFLVTAWERWKVACPTADVATPNYSPPRRLSRVPTGVVGQLGYYSTSTSCPILEHTWEAIYWSAQTALEGAEQIKAGEQLLYSLCRPPGHHAYKDATNGFCFLNNAALAAESLLGKFDKVAILDIDTHAGQGTQDIFYDRADVFFGSIHVDPSDYPPYYMGYEDEKGVGDGLGTNRNICLAKGSGDPQILDGISRLTSNIQEFGAEALVVSLGFDMSGDDPLAEVNMTTDGFRRAASRIRGMDLPTLLVQEGGYLGPSLANNAVGFLESFENHTETCE